MRIAFPITQIGHWWTGGVHYLINLFSALYDLPGRPLEPVVFASRDIESGIIKRLEPHLNIPPVKSKIWTKRTPSYYARVATSVLLQKDYIAEKAFTKAGVDLVFQHSAWYGSRFSLPTLAWIGDLQHYHMPHFFSRATRFKRTVGYRALTRFATQIVVSSKNAKIDCESIYPKSRGKISVLPFAVKINPVMWDIPIKRVLEKYALPKKFFFLPNQLWKHKNHLTVIEAIKILKSRDVPVVIIACGNPYDFRDRDYPERLLSLVKEYRIEKEFRFLGLIPYLDMLVLIRACMALFNPSFFEGWSTTVEEAKSIGKHLILSDLQIHREQTLGLSPAECYYFNPHSSGDLADTLIAAWCQLDPGPHIELEKLARPKVIEWRQTFAQRFLAIVKKTLKKNH